MAHEEQQKQNDDTTTKQHVPDAATKPLPPREAKEDELDSVLGGSTNQDPCLL